MSLVITGAVAYGQFESEPHRLVVQYHTNRGVRIVRTFELERDQRKLWEVAVAIGAQPARKVRRPVYRCLDPRGEIVRVTDQSTVTGLIEGEVARNKSRGERRRRLTQTETAR